EGAVGGAGREEVPAPGEGGGDRGGGLERGPDPPRGRAPPRGRLDDPGDETEERRLARAVPADEPDRLSTRDLDRDVAESPYVRRLGLPALDEEILQRPCLAAVDAKPSGNRLDADLARLHPLTLEPAMERIGEHDVPA